MRIFLRTVLLLLVVIVPLSTNAQNITLKVVNSPMKLVLSEISRQSTYEFNYSSYNVDVDRLVSLDVHNAELKSVLGKLFSYDKAISTNIKNGVIYVYKKSSPAPKASTKKISGVVLDNAGLPIVGAVVALEGSSDATLTSLDGTFTVDLEKEDQQIEVSYIGFETYTFNTNARSYVEVKMQESVNELDEVVVVGYGAMKKSDLTGSVASVKTDDLPLAQTSSISQMMSGRAAGVTAIQSSAQPGGGVEINIRGAASVGAGNDPLYIIDGFPVSNTSVEPASDNRYSDYGSRNPLNSINPNDIESIEVLKDASSSAIYGARAANGVVIITTKRGREGNAVVTYNGSYSVQQIANQIDMLSSEEYMMEANNFAREKWLYNNDVYPYGTNNESDITGSWKPIYSEAAIKNAGAGTDWYGLITRNGAVQQHNVSVTGGTSNLSYAASFNYFDQKGVVKNSDFDRLSGRLNIDHQINKWLKYGVNATQSYVSNTNIPLGSEDHENSGLITAALTYDPTLDVKNRKGEYVISPLKTTVPNPVSMLEITDYTSSSRMLVSSYVEAKLFDGLTARVNAGFDDQRANRNSYIPKTTLYGKQSGGSASKSSTMIFDRLLEATLVYNKEISEGHRLNVLGGYSYQDFTAEGMLAANSDFSTDIFLDNSLAAGENIRPTVSSNKSVNKILSYFTRVNYSLFDKYLLTATMRADGSNKFGANNRYGYFPSMALAWRVSQEQFLQDVNWLSNLKVRLSYGQTGNSEIGNNAYELYTSTWNEYVFGDIINIGTVKYQMANPNLKWETTTEFNFGVDFGFLKERISGSVDIFSKEVSDLLGYKALKSHMEVGTIAANIGSTQSSGFEFTLRTANCIGEFKWNTDFNLTRYVDRWKERDPAQELSPWQNNNDPIRAIYGYLDDGILGVDETAPSTMPNLKAGQYKVKDVNGYLSDMDGNLVTDKNGDVQYLGKPDGKIDEADIVMLGTSDPGFSFGINNSFEYKRFDINIFFYGMLDRYVFNATRGTYSVPNIRFIEQGQNFMTEVKDRWSSENTDSTMPSGFTSEYPQPSTYLWEEGWFIRCGSISVGYSLPHKLIRKFASNVRVSAELGNPFVITTYSGNDPETDFKAGYPNQKTTGVALNITF